MGLLGELLAKNLKILRKTRGFTQESLASAAGLSPSGIQGIEYQDRWPSDATLERIATALNIPASALFSDRDLHVKPTPRQAIEVLTDLIEVYEKDLEMESSVEDLDVELTDEDLEAVADRKPPTRRKSRA